MSLEGSLETIALPEVLHLLSDTSKSGELLVSGDRGDGRLWFDAGRLSGFDVHRCSDPADALFELLRASSGRFSFDAGMSRPESANGVGEDENGADVRPVLEVAQARLEEWSGIVAVVPSLQHKASLSPEAPRESVEISAEQWSLVVTIGEGRTVGDVLDRAGLPEFEGCRSLKTLVEDGLVAVSEPDELPVVAEDLPVEAEDLSVVNEPEPVDEPEAVSAVEPQSLSDLEFGEVPEAPAAVVEEESSSLVVNGGAFDGHDFVFKTPAQLLEDSYEPQPVPYPEPPSNENGDHGVFDVESDDGSMTSRAALEALLAEIPGDEDGEGAAEFGGDVQEHDGLADRGPWTSQELASFDHEGGWHDDQPAGAAEHEEPESDFSSVEDVEPSAAAAASDFHFEAASEDDSEQPAELEATEESEEELEEPQPEPVNRGLLLKFLSSVRS